MLGFRPLYSQVRDKLIGRLVDGFWLPGQPLPSEIQLAAELGVSQGTVRKALDWMAADNLVVRRQGRGTFVAVHDDERMLFRFFRIIRDNGAPSSPKSQVLSLISGKANATERDTLNLAKDSRVVRIRRRRSLDDEPVMVEVVTLPVALFPDLATMDIPNNLYGLYAMHYGITIASTRERLKAVGATSEDAEALGISEGAPVLQVDRVAQALDGMPVEWRVSICLTRSVHYQSELR
jgi:GntR family transcriptional regulator